jgi:hypothetical protein
MNPEVMVSAIRSAASSPLALAAYLVASIAWICNVAFSVMPQWQVAKIISTYESDRERNIALRALLGHDPPAVLRRADAISWTKLKTKERAHFLLWSAYLLTLLAAIIVFALTVYRLTLPHPSDDPPVLINSSVERHR